MTAPGTRPAGASGAAAPIGVVHLVTTIEFGGLEKVVFASSGGTVYGEVEAYPIPETAPIRGIREAQAQVSFRLHPSSFCLFLHPSVRREAPVHRHCYARDERRRR